VLARRRLLAGVSAAAAVAATVQATAAPPPSRETVRVAATDLAAGEVVTAHDVTTQEYAPGTAPAGLVDDPVGRVLAAPVRRGEPITDVRLVGPGLADGHPGLTALPVRLPDAGAAGLLRAGDEIDLVAADPQGGPPRTVADGVTVLAVPDDVAESAGGGLAGRLVVLGVPPADVPEVADAAVRYFISYAFGR
jgi:Flp pilus assembly protein CpaB